MTPLTLATWSLLGRYTAAAPGATQFLGDALANAESGRAPIRETSTLALLFSVLWKLALVAAFIVATVWVLRRFLQGGTGLAPAGGGVRVLGVTHLDARHAVWILEVGERLLVVGGGDSLALLAEITQPVEQAAIRERLHGGGAGFGGALATWVSRMSGGSGPAELFKAGSEELKGRLQGLRRPKPGEPT